MNIVHVFCFFSFETKPASPCTSRRNTSDMSDHSNVCLDRVSTTWCSWWHCRGHPPADERTGKRCCRCCTASSSSGCTCATRIVIVFGHIPLTCFSTRTMGLVELAFVRCAYATYEDPCGFLARAKYSFARGISGAVGQRYFVLLSKPKIPTSRYFRNKIGILIAYVFPTLDHKNKNPQRLLHKTVSPRSYL